MATDNSRGSYKLHRAFDANRTALVADQILPATRWMMETFSDILDAADGLTADEQETLLEILQRRIAERNRARVAEEVNAARAELASGQAKPATVKVIMDEVCGEA